MSLDRRLRRTAFAAAVLGMLTLGVAEMNPIWLALIAAVAAAGWHFERRESAWSIGPKALNAILVGAIVFAAVDYWVLSAGWIVSLAHFLLIVQMAKLLLPKTDRDIAQIYLISVMNVAVAAIVAVDVFFAVTFALYSVAIIRGLILLHFQRELKGTEAVFLPVGADTARPTREPELRQVVSRRFFWTLGVIIAAAWAFNAVFFLFAPRVRTELFHLGPDSLLSRLTGFSESVRLGDIGRVMGNQSPVMHVELSDRDGKPLRGERNLYFRGLTYQHYDGREWQQLGPEFSGLRVFGPIRNLPFLKVARDDFSRPGVVRQDISMAQDIRTECMFTLEGAMEVRPLENYRAFQNRNCLDETWISKPPPRGAYKYRVWSCPDSGNRLYPAGMVVPSGRMALALPDTVRWGYLQVPEDVGPKVRGLAQQIVEGVPDASPAERARRIEQYLKRNFDYTLDLKPTPKVEPVQDFLFNTKKGHCEYFASSMVVLLRCAGVPARLVTGFHGGEFNDVGEWYLVKQSDAHAWVEAWVDGVGWMRFDPTPGAARDERAQQLAMGKFGRWLDYFRTSWMSYVVQYDEEHQSALLQHTRAASRSIRDAMGSVLSAVGGFLKKSLAVLTDLKRVGTTEGALIFVGTIAVSTALVLTARWLLLKLVRRLRESLARRRVLRIGRASVAFYQDLQKVLKQRGFVRLPAQTAMEFAGQVGAEMQSVRPALAELTDVFYRVRFGGERLAPEEERRLRAVIEQVRKAPTRGA